MFPVRGGHLPPSMYYPASNEKNLGGESDGTNRETKQTRDELYSIRHSIAGPQHRAQMEEAQERRATVAALRHSLEQFPNYTLQRAESSNAHYSGSYDQQQCDPRKLPEPRGYHQYPRASGGSYHAQTSLSSLSYPHHAPAPAPAQHPAPPYSYWSIFSPSASAIASYGNDASASTLIPSTVTHEAPVPPFLDERFACLQQMSCIPSFPSASTTTHQSHSAGPYYSGPAASHRYDTTESLDLPPLLRAHHDQVSAKCSHHDASVASTPKKTGRGSNKRKRGSSSNEENLGASPPSSIDANIDANISDFEIGSVHNTCAFSQLDVCDKGIIDTKIDKAWRHGVSHFFGRNKKCSKVVKRQLPITHRKCYQRKRYIETLDRCPPLERWVYTQRDMILNGLDWIEREWPTIVWQVTMNNALRTEVRRLRESSSPASLDWPTENKARCRRHWARVIVAQNLDQRYHSKECTSMSFDDVKAYVHAYIDHTPSDAEMRGTTWFPEIEASAVNYKEAEAATEATRRKAQDMTAQNDAAVVLASMSHSGTNSRS